MTVRAAPLFSANSVMVRMPVSSSRSPYRMRVGTRHVTGCSRTSHRYRHESVSPNAVGIYCRSTSSRSVTFAHVIILPISFSMSTTGEIRYAASTSVSSSDSSEK